MCRKNVSIWSKTKTKNSIPDWREPVSTDCVTYILKQLCMNQQNTADFPVTWFKDYKLGGDDDDTDDDDTAGNQLSTITSRLFH